MLQFLCKNISQGSVAARKMCRYTYMWWDH